MRNACLLPHEGEGWEGGAFDFKTKTIPFSCEAVLLIPLKGKTSKQKYSHKKTSDQIRGFFSSTTSEN